MKDIKCKEIYDNNFIELYLSGELDSDDVVNFEKHMDECNRCTSLLNDEKLILETIVEKDIVLPSIDLDKKILETISKESKETINSDNQKKNIFSIFSNNPYSSGLAVAVSVLIMIILTMSDNSNIEDIFKNGNGNNNNELYTNIEEVDIDLDLENYFSLEEDIEMYAYNEETSTTTDDSDTPYGFIDDTVIEDELDYYNYDDLNYYTEEEGSDTENISELEQELESMYEYLGV